MKKTYIMNYDFRRFKICASFSSDKDANNFIDKVDDIKFIKVGWFSYFLARNGYYKLAMLSFWD